MILSRKDLEYYLQEDQRALGLSWLRKPPIIGYEVWKYQIYLRKHEYYNYQPKTFFNNLRRKYYKYKHGKLGVQLGFSIPINVFGPGLRINHYGLIVINENAKIGANCDIHQGVNIGQNKNAEDVPAIGNNVWIGPGAKLFGKIVIADNIAIGANAVVSKSFEETNITIAGIPAQKVKDTGTLQMVTSADLK